MEEMMKYKIKILFITFLSLLLGSHALMPHHHHYDSFFLHGHPYASDIELDNHKSNSPDYHCHAFNNISDNGSQDKLAEQPFTGH
jgi:hypothetical protein